MAKEEIDKFHKQRKDADAMKQELNEGDIVKVATLEEMMEMQKYGLNIYSLDKCGLGNMGYVSDTPKFGEDIIIDSVNNTEAYTSGSSLCYPYCVLTLVTE